MPVNFYTTCIKIVRLDTTVIGMTELDKDITFDSVTYSSLSGYTPTETQTTSDLSVNNADIEGLIQSGHIERADIIAGLYDNADIFVFIYDWENEVKVRDLAVGSWGEVQLKDNAYTAEFRSLAQKLQQPIGEVVTAECNANLGDSRCGVTLATYTDTGSITTATSNSVIIDTSFIGTQADNYYNYGNFTFTSGLNNGLSREVKDYDDSTGEFTFILPFPFDIAVSDTFSVFAGCDKRLTTCINSFNNVVNFRGFPHLPGQDEITKVGGQ